MIRIFAAMFALLLTVPFDAGRALAPEPAKPSPTLSQLLDFIVAEKDVIASASGNFDAEFDKSLGSEGAEMEAQFPGLQEAVRVKSKAEMIQILREGYPQLRSQIGELVRQRMTETEIVEANAFYATPTGRKIIANANSSARGSTPEEITANSLSGAVRSVGAEDNEALMRFAKSPAFPKIKALGPELQKMSLAWAETLINANGARLEKAATDAASAHFAKIGAGEGKAK